MNGPLLAASYDAQLDCLERLHLAALSGHPSPLSEHMLLSLAESVKTARDHNLNCRREP